MATALAHSPPIPAALHRGPDELPFVADGTGTNIQLLQVDVEGGLWVVRTKLDPGTTLPRHKHTGEVFAVTFSGSWKYLEYPEVNRAGSYLFEPAGSIHTLQALDEGADVWFAIRGANLNLDDEGNVIGVLDASSVRDAYLALCEAHGHARPAVIGL